MSDSRLPWTLFAASVGAACGVGVVVLAALLTWVVVTHYLGLYGAVPAIVVALGWLLAGLVRSRP
jgi:hypothetical protein